MSVALASSTLAETAIPFPSAFPADDISIAIRRMVAEQRALVRVLPLALARMRTSTVATRSIAKWDFRVICDCQEHARRERALWRRSLRAATRVAEHVGRRGAALLVGVPLAIGALNYPIEAMNVASFTSLVTRSAARVQRIEQRALPIFTTTKVRESFLAPQPPQRTFTLDVAKEEFFRTHIPYGSVIYREAVKNNLPPELVAAVVESESDFRPKLVSNKNAQGLMQIVPETGRLMGVDDLFNPEQNVVAGTKYLRYLFDRFGDQRMVLAAYNAGEGNVERFGGVPPFPETINYLERVASRANSYRERVNGAYRTARLLRTPQPQ